MKYKREISLEGNRRPALRRSDSRLLLRVAEVMSQLSLSRPMVYQMIAAGELPSIRIGRAIRVPFASLENWVRQREGKLPAEETDDHREADR
jgi:excisionase family DNA binding protein